MLLLIDKIFFHNFIRMGFVLAEYNVRPKKGGGGEVVFPDKLMHIPENQVHGPGFVSKNYGIYALTFS